MARNQCCSGKSWGVDHLTSTKALFWIDEFDVGSVAGNDWLVGRRNWSHLTPWWVGFRELDRGNCNAGWGVDHVCARVLEGRTQSSGGREGPRLAFFFFLPWWRNLRIRVASPTANRTRKVKIKIPFTYIWQYVCIHIKHKTVISNFSFSFYFQKLASKSTFISK